MNDTPIEKTRCGSCKHLEADTCPNKNHKGTYVPSFFADQCSKHEA